MKPDLEIRWQEALRQKNLTPNQLNSIIDEVENKIAIPHDWNQRIQASIRKEKSEIEKRYGIRFGQTEVYCTHCNKPCWPGRHTCQEIKFKQLREKEKERQEVLKQEGENLLGRLRKMGARKVSTMLYQEIEDSKGNKTVLRDIPEETVSTWIRRESIPKKHIEDVEALINSVQI